MLYLLFVPLLAIHLLAMNVATAGPIVALWFQRRGRKREDGPASWVADQLVRHSMLALAVGIGLGLAAGAVLYGADGQRLRAAIGALPYGRLWWGVWELAFYFLCMALYLVLQSTAQRNSTAGVVARTMQWVLVWSAVTNLAYHFPLLFSVLAQLRSSATSADIAPIGTSELLKQWMQPRNLAMFIHFLMASVATSGVLVMFLGLRLGKIEANQPAQWRIGHYGARIALVPTLLQLVGGVYLLFVLPQNLQDAMMGDNLVATSLFVVSVLVALALMHCLAGVALGQRSRASMIQAGILLVVTVLLMTASLHAARVGTSEVSFLMQ